MYEYEDSGNESTDSRPQSRASRRDRQEKSNGHYDNSGSNRSEHNNGGKHSHRAGGEGSSSSQDKIAGSDDMW